MLRKMWELKGYCRIQKRRQLLLQPPGGSSTENRHFSSALWAIGGNAFSKKMRPSSLIAFSLLYCSYSQHTINKVSKVEIQRVKILVKLQ